MFAELLKAIFRRRGAHPAVSVSVSVLGAGADQAKAWSIQVAAGHVEAGELVRAQEIAAQLLRTDPQHADAWNLLGAIALAGGHDEIAVREFEHAIELEPQNTKFLSNCGEACRRAGWIDDAIEHCRAAVASAPSSAIAFYNLGAALLAAGEAEQAHSALKHGLALQPGAITQRSSLLFVLCHLENFDRKEILAEHMRWNELHARALAPLKPPQLSPTEPARKIRVGFVSADFRQHSLAYFIEPLFAHHDRERFEFFGYSNTLKPDDVTGQLRPQVAHWRDITALSDEGAAGLIAEDQIDVLIDLSGHTARSRLLVFARKPAPVQITYVGYPNTTGMTAMDYRISDSYMDPPGVSEAMYTETLLRMPHGLWCYRPPALAPAINALPAQKNGWITFGSPHGIAKINQSVLEVWADVLEQVPDSRLVMAGVPEGATRRRLKESFSSKGIEASRIEILGKLNFDDYFKFYHRVDVVLDAFPYTGGTTTCESLWMGIPVITLAGDYGVSRAGVSLLSGAGLSEMIAASVVQYAQIAVRLSRDVTALAELRAGLRERLKQSSLMDEVGFTRAFEGQLVLACHMTSNNQ